MTRSVETPQSECRFAMARGDITPPVGIYHRMWGAATHEHSLGVHRPLFASVMLFAPVENESPENDLQVLVALDLCLFGVQELEMLLATCRDKAGIDPRSITVTFSHTHATGLLVLDRESSPGGELIPPYLEQLCSTVASLVSQCIQNLEPACIVYGRGKCNLAAFRDYWDEEREEFVCGFNPDTDADDCVLVARATSAEQRCLATVVNYACHPTTLAWQNQLISPDYPGAMREVVESTTEAPCVFIQGACGDLGPRNGFVGDPATADRNGRQLGFAALSALESLAPPGTSFSYQGAVVSGATIGTWKNEPMSDQRRRSTRCWKIRRLKLDINFREGLPTVEQIESERTKWLAAEQSAEEKGEVVKTRDCRAMVERKTRLLSRLQSLPAGDTYPYECVVWRMGDAIWVSVQAEPYNRLQTELRRRFPDFVIVIASISSHWGPTYLPPADIYGKGIYQESIAVLEPGCLEKVIESLANCIKEMI